ncbi:hypothetical protein [Sorangium atrum]|uniref:Secreted protein n=1 Tax=Sorangium atrum TaxID=2995308 RepID=A0ABT5CHQ1_9BACT|nr:hypothetical protein [Sorangium aterium]MDC0685917.1 hypothetical protein [Sorangium aterium]
MRCVLLLMGASAGLGCVSDRGCPAPGPHEGDPAVWLWDGTQNEAPGCAEDRDVLWDGWLKGSSTAPESPTFARACAGVVRDDIPDGYTLCVIPTEVPEICWEGYEDRSIYVEEDGEEHVMCCTPAGNPPMVIPQSYGACTT